MRRVLAVVAAAGIGLMSAGCASAAGGSNGGGDPTVVLRLGYLQNITHAPALVGIKEGFFTKNLGSHVTVHFESFSTGTEEATALLAGQLDAAYVGPNPAISTWQKSQGTEIKVISGAASGGAALVVKKGITSAAQLKGQRLATPSLGNTQDVALRYWLKQQGLTTTTTGGGDVDIAPTSPNSAAVLEFKSGQIAGGWEPAPYDAEMVADGGHVLVNEASTWPGGQFVTTEIVATQSFIKASPTQAESVANAELAAVSGKSLPPAIVAASFDQITFTNDPIASSLITDASNAVSVGLLTPVPSLSAIYDLGPLNKLLTADGQPRVSS